MNTEQIGSTAGKVWHALDAKGEMSVTALKKAVGGTDSMVDYAIGWLAREGKVFFRKEKNVVKVGLKK